MKTIEKKVTKESVLGYVNESTRGNMQKIASDDPLFEAEKCGTEYFPMRMFTDCRYKGNDIFPHIHTAVEIICMTQGEMNLVINNRNYHVWEGCIAVINSMEVHMIIGDDAMYYVMQIEPELFDKYGVNIADVLPKHNHVIEQKVSINASLTRKIEHAFENIGECNESERITVLSDIFGMFAILMNYTEKIDDTDALSKVDQKSVARLKSVFAYVEQNYAREITVDEISEHVYLAKTYFCRFFKQSMGMTFIEYLNRYRCNKVDELLKNTDYSITEIATSVGFNNISYFNKTYKKLRGESPSKLRK